MKESSFSFVLLRANPDPVRSEMMNAGIVVFDNSHTSVILDSSNKRLPALHPDFARMDLLNWADQIQSELRKYPTQEQKFILSMLCAPFVTDKILGITTGESAQEQAEALFNRLVAKQAASLSRPKKNIIKASKLSNELKSWFRDSKIFSNKIEDLSNHLVVANYPVDPSSDLYADFALMNGRLNVMETLDLRNVDHLTPTLRGDAAIKGITLSEAKGITLSEAGNNAHTIAIISASDYGIAKPAISLIGRFADDVYDLPSQSEKQRLVDFMTKSLKRPVLNLPFN